MTRTDIPLLGGQLNALAEVFGKTPVTVKAMEVWFDAMKDFPTEWVMDVLNSWAKYNGRFPMPAQVVEKVNNTVIDFREKKAAFERKENAGPIENYASPAAEKYIEQIREILKRPVTPMRERWVAMLEDKSTPFWKRKMAEEAVANLGIKLSKPVEREPGSDDDLPLGIGRDALERELAERMNP